MQPAELGLSVVRSCRVPFLQLALATRREKIVPSTRGQRHQNQSQRQESQRQRHQSQRQESQTQKSQTQESQRQESQRQESQRQERKIPTQKISPVAVFYFKRSPDPDGCVFSSCTFLPLGHNCYCCVASSVLWMKDHIMLFGSLVCLKVS